MAISNTAFTEENLYALELAIVEGTRRVKYTDKEVEYRSLDEMLKIRDLMRSKLGKKVKCGKAGLFGGRRIVMCHSKGLDPGSSDGEDC